MDINGKGVDVLHTLLRLRLEYGSLIECSYVHSGMLRGPRMVTALKPQKTSGCQNGSFLSTMRSREYFLRRVHRMCA